MRRLPPLPAVRAFEAVARNGTFTAAASELGMTQAAISYQIKILEERVGEPLFFRRGRRAELTAGGARVAARLASAFDEIEMAFDELTGESETVLRIATTASIANNWLARNIGAFHAVHPDIEIELEVSSAVIDFAESRIDVAIRTGRGDWPALKAEHLATVFFTPMCSPALLEGRSLPLDAREAREMQRISPQDRWWPIWFRSAGVDDMNEPKRGGIRMDSQASEGQAAIAGHGLALMTPMLWSSELASGLLVRPFAQVADEGTAYWFVYAENQRRSRKVARFRDWVVPAFRAAADSFQMSQADHKPGCIA
ncbi:LysR substrate-binding domain-containing protein [Sphingomonas sp. NPDC092331]|jgi:LysR family transcriptional regulator, glycine cleavage system transcriptional activator|uniref:LysR substrate-binding domain-containing protein n=1 Tax=unclassified Sphingomonas TaxID=196159 RepID=UPI0031F58D91